MGGVFAVIFYLIFMNYLCNTNSNKMDGVVPETHLVGDENLGINL